MNEEDYKWVRACWDRCQDYEMPRALQITHLISLLVRQMARAAAAEFQLVHRFVVHGFGASDRESNCTGCDDKFDKDPQHDWLFADWEAEQWRKIKGEV